MERQAEPPIGLIAGEGRLPVVIAAGIRAAGRRVACVGLSDLYHAELPGLCDAFATAGMVRLGRWMHLLRRFGVREAIMVGRVRKVHIYEPMRIFRAMPDWRAMWLFYRVLRHDRRNDAVLEAVARELAKGGVTLIDSTQYIPDHLADEGVLTQVQPTANAQADIAFGLPIVQRMGDLDIGQSLAVRDREVVAVEAIEGTDRMIERAGKLAHGKGWTLIKTGKPHQDMRFDVPTIGINTIKNLKEAGAVCLAVEVGKVILLDKPDVLAAADAAKIAIVGVRP